MRAASGTLSFAGKLTHGVVEHVDAPTKPLDRDPFVVPVKEVGKGGAVIRKSRRHEPIALRPQARPVLGIG